MKIHYDAEFIEDGRTVDLISIGMVADDDRELYFVNQNIEDDQELHRQVCEHRWLMEHVIPSLPLLKSRPGASPRVAYALPTAPTAAGVFRLDRLDHCVRPPSFIRNEVRDFILATPDPQLWAWYGAYDHVVYAQLFGRMIDLPDGLPMFTCDLKQEAVRLGDPRVPEQEHGQHNALEDARHNRVIAEFLAGYAAKAGA